VLLIGIAFVTVMAIVHARGGALPLRKSDGGNGSPMILFGGQFGIRSVVCLGVKFCCSFVGFGFFYWGRCGIRRVVCLDVKFRCSLVGLDFIGVNHITNLNR